MAALYDKALKRKDFRALPVRRRRRRAKIERRRRTTGSENVCIHLFYMCRAILTVNLGKKKAEKEKAAKADNPKAGAHVGNIVAEDASGVSHSLSFLCPDIGSRN